MKRSRMISFAMGKALIQLIALAVTLTLSSQILAKKPDVDDHKVFDYSTDSEAVIISYSETPQMLGNADTTPRIQVFGDGYVWVHYPEYMKKAGDYEVWLNPGEIRQLLLALSGVFDFDPKAVKQSRKLMKAAREQQDGVAYFRSDDTVEEIDVRLKSYKASPVAASKGVDLNLKWKNIAADARDYPDLEEVQKLKGARNSIRALLERGDLVKLDQMPTKGEIQ